MKQISAKQKQANFFRGMAELAERGRRGEIDKVREVISKTETTTTTRNC